MLALEDAPLRPGATPVGAFPRGHTPDHLRDLAGNVFQWCATISDVGVLDLPTADEEDDPGEVIYRGGCWQRTADALAVTRQGDHAPGGDGNWIGFRAVCRPRMDRRGATTRNASAARIPGFGGTRIGLAR